MHRYPFCYFLLSSQNLSSKIFLNTHISLVNSAIVSASIIMSIAEEFASNILFMSSFPNAFFSSLNFFLICFINSFILFLFSPICFRILLLIFPSLISSFIFKSHYTIHICNIITIYFFPLTIMFYPYLHFHHLLTL